MTQVLESSSRVHKGAAAAARGFSLIELITAIAVLAILTAIAVPGYQYITYADHLSDEANSLVSTLWEARAEAIMEGRDVTVCPSSDGKTCTGGVASWTTGWIVFSDSNGNQTVDGGETVRYIRGAFTSKDTVDTAPTANAVTFNREGFATGIAQDVTFSFHPPAGKGTPTRCVLLQRMGSASTELAGVGACE